MKKLLICSNVLSLFVIIALISAYQKPRLDCPTSRCNDFSQAPWTETISAQEAVRLSANYEKDVAKKFIFSGDTRTTELDARSIWFSLEVMKRFLWQIEYANCKSGCKDSLGIRMYYAKYDEDQINTRKLHPSYANHHTLFMVPTYWDRNKKSNVDYDVYRGCRRQFDVGKKYDKTLIFFITPTSRPHASLTYRSTGAAAASTKYYTAWQEYLQNRGGVAPPPPQGGTFPNTGGW